VASNAKWNEWPATSRRRSDSPAHLERQGSVSQGLAMAFAVYHLAEMILDLKRHYHAATTARSSHEPPAPIGMESATGNGWPRCRLACQPGKTTPSGSKYRRCLNWVSKIPSAKRVAALRRVNVNLLTLELLPCKRCAGSGSRPNPVDRLLQAQEATDRCACKAAEVMKGFLTIPE